MITPIESDTLEQALVEVRKAYRLLWMFQSRILDVCRELISQFDVEFYQTSFADKPGRGDSNPLSSRVWAMTPMQEMSLLFLNRDSSSKEPRDYPCKGDYLIEMRFVADTGRNEFRKSDADPARFPRVDACKTTLALYLFVNDLDRTDPTNWYNGIWSNTDYPPHDESSKSAIGGVRVYGYEYDISQLVDQNAIVDCARKFKQRVREKLALELTNR